MAHLRSFTAKSGPTLATLIYTALHDFTPPGVECGGYPCRCGKCVFDLVPGPRRSGASWLEAPESTGFGFSVSVVR